MKREEQLFEQLLTLRSPEDQANALGEACAGDDQLRRRVEELLAAHNDAAGLAFFQRTEGTSRAAHDPRLSVAIEAPGTHIGRYKLLEKIGEGGCGVVYMAEQEEPVRRKVALKIIKAGMDSRQVIARFEAERQALAMMDHPNIAKFFDAGTIQTQSGEGRMQNPSADSPLHTLHSPLGSLPYFVMELVRGVRITDYCTQNNLPTRQRLDLFIQVCNAVQHAHQKGIIHRDLKPSNILVTENDGKPVPKVIDFGIAKATEGQLTDKTVFTQFAAFMGTPAYMSPEQAAMTSLDIDTRSDIYSLGVLLYELLTGTTPFDAQELLKAGFDEMRRVIRETEPEKPSTRLTQRLRRGPQSPLITPHSALATDLDWIVMKCLEKERGRRYETANELAAELERHLSDEPVRARPPSNWYRLHKVMQRNKLAFSWAVALVVSVVTGIGIAGWQFVEKSRAYQRVLESERLARSEAAQSEAIAKFFKDMILGLKPSVALGRDTSVLRDLALSSLEEMKKRTRVTFETELELRVALGEALHVLGEYEKAEALHRESLARMRNLGVGDKAEMAGLIGDLACVLRHRGKNGEAAAVAQEAIEIARARHGEDHPTVAKSICLLAAALDGLKRHEEAEAQFRSGINLFEKIQGEDSYGAAQALNGLAATLDHQHRHEEAVLAYRKSLFMMKRIHGDADANVAYVLREFAISEANHSRNREAEDLFRELLPLQRKFLGSENAKTARTLNALTAYLVNRGQPAEAEIYAREAVAIHRKVQPGDSEESAKAIHDLAMCLADQNRPREAEPLFHEAIAMQQRLRASGNPDLMRSRRNLSRLLVKEGRFSEAEPLIRAILQQLQSEPNPDTEDVLDLSANLARLLTDWAWKVHTEKPAAPPRDEMLPRALEAVSRMRTCIESKSRSTTAAGWAPHEWMTRLGAALVSLTVMDLEMPSIERAERLAEAERLLVDGHEGLQQNPAAGFRYRLDAIRRLIRLYEAWEKKDQAAEWRHQMTVVQQAQERPPPIPTKKK